MAYITHHSLRHSYARYLRKQGYSTQSIGKLLGHKAGSSMTVMYADFADDEVVDLGQNVPMDVLQNLAKK